MSTDEVYALLNYAANCGVEEENMGTLSEKIEALSKVIHEQEPDPTTVAARYTDLVSLTRPVTGRTILHSHQHVRRLWSIVVVTTIVFVLAVGNYIVDNWVADMVVPEEGLFWLNVKRYAWDYLTPFFWGSLGACIFLLKSIQDAARANEYDHHLNQGWEVRVLMGGVLASIVLIIFDPATFSTESLPLRPAAIAFLTGLGVKAVYGGLERLIDEVARRVSADSEGSSSPSADQGDSDG